MPILRPNRLSSERRSNHRARTRHFFTPCYNGCRDNLGSGTSRRDHAMKYALAFAPAFALFFPLAAVAITIDTVPVGNPGNPSRADGGIVVGGVSTAYRIATTEVTNAQYVTF